MLSAIFAKHSILDFEQGSQYASGLLKLLFRGCKKDTQESLIYTKLIKVFTPNLEFSPCYEVIHRSATFKLAKG